MTFLNALELKIPPPLILLGFAAMMYGLDMLFPYANENLLLFQMNFRITLVTMLLIIGVYIAFAGIYIFKKHKTTANPLKPNRASSLVTSGVYQFTRNPMYVGLFCVLMAYGIFLANIYILLVPFVFAAFISYFQIRPEERALEKIFGDEFIDYKQKVRRWI